MTSLVCADCGLRLPPEGAPPACACGGLFDAEHAGQTRGAVLRARFEGRTPIRFAGDDGLDLERASGVWRFRELVDPTLPVPEVVSLLEGNTPLLRSAGVSAWAGLGTDGPELLLKHEGMNPTGSFKDRGMTVAVSRARRGGARLLACASTGNTAASLAAYAAAAGLPCAVLAPAGGAAPAKLAQAAAHGGRTILVRGDFDRALALARELAGERRLTLVNSIDPFRVEGQKSIVLELLLQLGWEPPDWLLFPAGNLGNCAAFGKALVEARAAGLIERLPRLVAVQAEGAAPFARAFERGLGELEPVRATTVASAIRIGAPASYRRAVRAIRATDGLVLAVSDEALLAAKAALDHAGIGAEPASAAPLAGLARLRAEGRLVPATPGRRARAVVVLTGHLLKDPLAGAAGADRALPGAVTIEPTRKALLACLAGLGEAGT